MNRPASVTRGPACFLNKSKRLERNPQHVPGGAWVYSRDALRKLCSSLLQLCGAALTQKSAPEPGRHAKWEVRVCKAGSQSFIPDVWSLRLFPCLTEQPDRMMGPSWLAPMRGDVGAAQPRLAQALLWILIIHQDSGLAFIPLTFECLKPIRNISSVSGCRNTSLCEFICVGYHTLTWLMSHVMAVIQIKVGKGHKSYR